MKRYFLYGIPKSLLLKIIIGLLILLLGKNVFALEVDVTNSITSGGSFQPTQGHYQGTEIYETGTNNWYAVKTRYNGRLSRIRYNLPLPTSLGQCFTTNLTYTITMNMATEDWRNKFGSVYVGWGSGATNWATGGVTYVSYKKIYFKFKIPASDTNCYDFVFIDLKSSNLSSTAFTGTSNWNLSKVTLTDPSISTSGGSSGGSSTPTPTPRPDYSDIINNQNQNTQDLIDNQNQNTQDIIDNNNTNTQEIKDTIDNNFQNCRESNNLLDLETFNQTQDGVTVQVQDNAIKVNGSNSSGSSLYFDIPLKSEINLNDGLYKMFFQKLGDYIGIQTSLRNSNKGLIGLWSNNLSNVSNETLTGTASYFRIQINNGVSVNSAFLVMVSKNSSYTYEKPGKICTNKLDTANDIAQDTNNYLKDDTDPNMNDSEITDLFGDVGWQDPLNYLLTLPTTFINKIVSLSDSCQMVDLGTLWGVSIKLPCLNLEQIIGSSVWHTIDILIGIGLLLNIFRNLYHTWANLTSLGAEKKARETFSFPSPMDFLANIFGGGSE